MMNNKNRIAIDEERDGLIQGEWGAPENDGSIQKKDFYTQDDIQRLFGKEAETKPTLRQRCVSSFVCTKRQCGSKLLSFIPIINVIYTYKWREYLVGDILGGVSAACLHFPQGLAFGLLASLSAANGLYTGFFAIVFYMIFGTSPHVSFGTNAVIALFTAEMVESHVQGMNFPAVNQSIIVNSTHTDSLLLGDIPIDDIPDILSIKVATAAGASMMVGLMLIAMAILRLGFITAYMSASFVHAFVSACAFHIATSQLPGALGVKIPLVTGIGKLIFIYVNIFKAIKTANIATFIVFFITVVVLILVKDCINERYKHKMKIPIPIDLIVIILATIISHFGKFNHNFGVSVVGDLPSGMPPPMFPKLTTDILGTRFIVAILVFVLTIAMVRTCEEKHGYHVDDNQELLAYGLSNLGAGFFHCFPSCTAPPRTMVLSSLGSKTTLNGLFSAIIMLLIILVLGPLFKSVPHPVLSAMVVVAVKTLMLHFLELPNFWRTNKYDFCIWIGTFLSGILLDIPFGLYIGAGLGLLTTVVQSQRASRNVIGIDTHSRLFLDKGENRGISDIPGIKIFRMESSLYFATATIFKNALYAETGDPRKTDGLKENGIDSDYECENDIGGVRDSTPLQYIVLDCSTVNYIDMNGMKTLAQIVRTYNKKDICVVLCNCSKVVRESLKTNILSTVFPNTNVCFSLQDAIEACQKRCPEIPQIK